MKKLFISLSILALASTGLFAQSITIEDSGDFLKITKNPQTLYVPKKNVRVSYKTSTQTVWLNTDKPMGSNLGFPDISLRFADVSSPSAPTLSALADSLVSWISSSSGVASYGIPESTFKIGSENSTTISRISGTAVALSGNYPTITSNASLVYLKVSGSSGSKFYVNGASGVSMTHSAGVVIVSGADAFTATDVFELGINGTKYSNDYPNVIGGYDGTNPQAIKTDTSGAVYTVSDASGIPQANTKVGTERGTVTYASSTTVTLSGNYPSITNDAFLVYFKRVPSSGNTKYYINGVAGITLRHSGGVVTISGAVASDTLATGDVYELGINAPLNSEDYDLEAQTTNSINPDWTRLTDPVTHISTQDLTVSYADFGDQIDMTGYKALTIFAVCVVNDSENVTLRVTGEYESGGTLDFEINGFSEVTLWTTGASNFNKIYGFELSSPIKYLQIQAKASTVGATAGNLTLTIAKFY